MFGEQTFAQLRTGFTSTETAGTLRDEEPKTPFSTFTQLLSSDICCYYYYYYYCYCYYYYYYYCCYNTTNI